MSSFIKHLGNEYYKRTLGKDLTQKNTYDILDAWAFFTEAAKDWPQARYCALSVQREGDHFNVLVFLLNDCMERIMKSSDTVVGRKVSVYNLSENLVNYLNGESHCLLDLNTLLFRQIAD